MAHNNSTTYTCRFCGADMLPSRTPGGEACYECQNRGCQFVAMIGAECSMIAKPNPPTTPAARKALYNLSQGIQAVPCGAGWLVPSSTRSIVHYVADGSCSCEAGKNSRACWHVALVELSTPRRAA